MSRALPDNRTASGHTTNVAAEARKAFARWVDETPEGRLFAQVLVRSLSPGYELRHADDAGREDLTVYEDPRGAREISKLTEDGEYRPLKSSPNLRQGWSLRVSDDRELATAMNHLYPAALVHWHLYREGRLEVTNYRENAARQSGIYKRVQRLTDEGVQDAGAGVLRRRSMSQKDPLGRGRGQSPPDG